MRGRVLHSNDCIQTDGTFETPVKGLRPVLAVRTLCVRYRDPGYPEDFIFPARRLPGAVDPPNVLRPEDLIERGGANYTPRFGFGPRHDRARLDQAGHRMINHHNRSVPLVTVSMVYGKQYRSRAKEHNLNIYSQSKTIQ